MGLKEPSCCSQGSGQGAGRRPAKQAPRLLAGPPAPAVPGRGARIEPRKGGAMRPRKREAWGLLLEPLMITNEY